MYGGRPTLREQQADQVRAAVLDATLAALETKDVDDIAMAEIADSAGVSLRTLYRYFADRNSLLNAAGDHLLASLGMPVAIAGPDQLASSFLEAARKLGARPKLVRALVRSRAGQAVRARGRSKRVEGIRRALDPLTGPLDPVTARRGSAILTHLCSAAAWVAVADEAQLSDGEAQDAVAWAIEALIRVLRDEALNGACRTTSSQSQEK